MSINKSVSKTAFSLLLVLFIFFTTSCMSPTTISKSREIKKEKLTREYFEERFNKLCEELKENRNLLSPGKKTKRSLEWYLDGGSIARYAYHLRTSLNIWDFADTQINIYEQKLLEEKAAQEFASLLINDWVKNYTPPIYERVFLNIFQAFNDLSLQNIDDANIELNRAISRLKHAEKIFKREIERAKKEAEEKQREKRFSLSKKNLEPIEKAYSVLDKFKPYSKFENPLVYYLKGIIYYEWGDYYNAAEMFKIAYGLVKDKEPAAKQVAKDWELTQKPERHKHHLWVIYLNGLSFEKVERRFDIPLFLVTGDVIYTGISLPWLKERPKTSETLYIQTHDGKVLKTQRLVNVNALIAWEFKKRLPALLTREITRAAVKTLTQYEINKHFGTLAGLVFAIYQFVTTKADIRQWYWLPKEIQIVRVEFEPGKPIFIKVSGHKTKRVVFPADVKDAIIIVRGFKPQDEVWYYEVLFKR
jgi:hypothetical protein